MVRSELGMFLDGELATLRVGLHRADLLGDQSAGEELGVSLFPSHPTTGRRGSALSGVGYCIGAQSAMASEALLWIKYMCAREMGIQMFLGRYAEPGCRMASWTDPRVLDRFPLCAQLALLCEEARPERLPWNLSASACLEAWNTAWKDLHLGQRSPQSAATQACRRIGIALAAPIAA
jgi:hypothetical protein